MSKKVFKETHKNSDRITKIAFNAVNKAAKRIKSNLGKKPVMFRSSGEGGD